MVSFGLAVLAVLAVLALLALSFASMSFALGEVIGGFDITTVTFFVSILKLKYFSLPM